MSFVHYYLVAHVDPLDLIDMSVRPVRIKIVRPIDVAMFEEVLAEFVDIADCVTYTEDGAVRCDWAWVPPADHDLIAEFTRALADRAQAVVVDQRYFIVHPPDAQRLYLALGWVRGETSRRAPSARSRGS